MLRSPSACLDLLVRLLRPAQTPPPNLTFPDALTRERATLELEPHFYCRNAKPPTNKAKSLSIASFHLLLYFGSPTRQPSRFPPLNDRSLGCRSMRVNRTVAHCFLGCLIVW
eukprot:6204347-Pleurochrysis_carterae.AAC.1